MKNLYLNQHPIIFRKKIPVKIIDSFFFPSLKTLVLVIDEDDTNSSPPISRRLAFIGEFNSTPYVIVSPSVQKQLIYDARKNNGKEF
jgi:hypothetical protein